MFSRSPQPPLPLVVVTQAALGLMLLVGIATIALLPAASAGAAVDLPEFAGLRLPLLALAIAFTALGVIALAMIVVLVHRIHRGTILTRSSLRRVDILIAASIGGVALVLAAYVVISNGQSGFPLLVIAQALTCLGLTAVACITLVLRSLLRTAISIRTELDEVI